MSYRIIFYDLPKSGRVPVVEFLDSLNQDHPDLHDKTFRNIELLEEYGPELGMPFVKHLEEGIYELRSSFGSNASRIMYFYYSKNRNDIVMTNGFLKKTQKTPKTELDKAKKYKSEYESR